MNKKQFNDGLLTAILIDGAYYRKSNEKTLLRALYSTNQWQLVITLYNIIVLFKKT